jgi:aminoglycoside phosphotransferase (APT) family kinase protein
VGDVAGPGFRADSPHLRDAIGPIGLIFTMISGQSMLRRVATVPDTEPVVSGLDDELRRWIESRTGQPISRGELFPGGNRRQAWRISLGDSEAVKRLFLRYDPTDPALTGDPYTLRREAVICAAIAGSGLPVAQVVAAHPTLQAVLTTYVEGDNAFHRVRDGARRVAIAQDFMRHLATLHRLGPSVLAGVPGFDPRASAWDYVHAELDRWEGMYRDTGRHDPMIEFGLGWLRRNVPRGPIRVSLVHGDAGPGNFLFADEAVAAVLDWELAHLGDPMEDLAWLSVRTAQETFPDYAERLAEYERLVGEKVDPLRLRYHRVFAELRILVIRHRALGDVNPNGDIGNGLLSAALHRRLFVESLGDVTGVALAAPPLPEPRASPRGWLYEAMLFQLRTVVERSTDSLVVSRAKGIVRVIKYLQRCDEMGAELEAAELSDLTGLLGTDVRSLDEGSARLTERIRADAVAPEDIVRYFGRSVARDTHVKRTALGALAERHHPGISRGVAT